MLSRMLRFFRRGGWLAAAVALTLVLVYAQRNRLQTPPVGGALLPIDTIALRVVFGDRQEAPRDYSGSLTVSPGRVIAIQPWRLFPQDAINGTQWKLRTRYVNFENQPQQPPRVLNAPSGVQNIVPEGITALVEAPSGASATLKTAAGTFTFAIDDLRLGRMLSFNDGDVTVQRTVPSQQISETAAEWHDYPSVARTRSGQTWVVWQAYRDRADRVYARRVGDPRVYTLAEKADVFGTALAEDVAGRLWAVWSERAGQEWHLWTRTWDGKQWTARRRLTSGAAPNMFHRIVRARDGGLHLVWIGYRDGQSRVFRSQLRGGQWSAPVEVSGPNAWAPSAALDSRGNLWVAWDSYAAGNYDIYLRRVAPGGAMDPVQQVTRSYKFQAHPSVAVDRQDRVWLAWDESGGNWGKDYSHEDTFRAVTLYTDRRPRVAVLENGAWKAPAADLMAAAPRRYNRYVQLPRLVCDERGRMWVSLQVRTYAATSRADIFSGGGRWERFVSSLEGDHWTPLAPLPDSDARPEAPFDFEPVSDNGWMASWVNVERGPGRRSAEMPHRIFTGTGANSAPVAAPVLADFADDAGTIIPVHANEAADVARMRAYRTHVGGAELRILRGDFHRHTEISQDGAGDGSLEDYFRYMLDAAAMDTGIISDHSAGNNNEYTWWRTEKAIDLFLIRGRYTPLFGYERSVPYPNGHRNVVFPERGVRTLPISMEEMKGKVNSGPILYPYLKQNRGIAMEHSLATQQGTDWRDNDPAVEPLVEIYQGYHANYEYAGAPRAESDSYQVNVHGGYAPLGFYWNALKKGYKLGVQSSSDHVSTHVSYTLIYTPTTGRADIVESMRKRHAYGATDNILLEFRAGENMMGDAFRSAAPPRMQVKAIGTAPIARIEVIKDGKFVYERSPNAAQVEFEYRDTAPEPRESWYYVRVRQIDGNLAWSSPMWVDYRK